MPFNRVVHRLARQLSVSPARSTVWEWHKAEGDQVTIDAELHQWTTDSLSGVLCIDELYDKEFCLLVATDPLADLTVGFQLLEKNDADATKVAEFMDYLTSIGAKPEVVITDEFKLYPAALRESGWGDVLHQLCNFHFFRLVVTDIVASVRALNVPRDFAVQVYDVSDAKDRISADLASQAILTDERFRADPNFAKSVARLVLCQQIDLGWSRRSIDCVVITFSVKYRRVFALKEI